MRARERGICNSASDSLLETIRIIAYAPFSTAAPRLMVSLNKFGRSGYLRGKIYIFTNHNRIASSRRATAGEFGPKNWPQIRMLWCDATWFSKQHVVWLFPTKDVNKHENAKLSP